MTDLTKKTGGWSAVRRQLSAWEKPALLALLKDLYETAAVNRDFIHARSKTGESGGEALKNIGAGLWSSSFLSEAMGN